MLKRLYRLQEKYAYRDVNPQVKSYQTLRKTIGWLGVFLPFAMVLGAWLLWGCTTWQPSISHYYYTNMREVFVGVICSVALFLFTYTGPSRLDGWASNLAGLFALGIALFPTTVLCKDFTGFVSEASCFPCQQKVSSFTRIPHHSLLHFTSAGLFFFTLSFMSIFLFRLTHSKKEMTAQKRLRNDIYLWCGIIMLASIAAAGLFVFFSDDEQSTFVFWAEAVALLAFGVSWLTKGEMIAGDADHNQN